jgi:hypothetical protein
MKTVLAATLLVAVTVLATPAMAYVVEITTSIPLAGIADRTQLREAVISAVDAVVNNAIAFSPTMVSVENAWVVEDRMYLQLLITDSDGEQTLKAVSAERPARGETAPPLRGRPR